MLAIAVLGGPSGAAHGEIFIRLGSSHRLLPRAHRRSGGRGYTGGSPVGSISTTFPNSGTQSLRIDPIAIQYFGATGFRYLPGGASPIFEGEGPIVSVKVEAALIGPSTDKDLISVNFMPLLFSNHPDYRPSDIFESEIYLSSDGHFYFRGTALPALPGQYNELEAGFDFPDQKTIYFLITHDCQPI